VSLSGSVTASANPTARTRMKMFPTPAKVAQKHNAENVLGFRVDTKTILFRMSFETDVQRYQDVNTFT
jgi:hypothetical protein